MQGPQEVCQCSQENRPSWSQGSGAGEPEADPGLRPEEQGLGVGEGAVGPWQEQLC